MFRALRSSDDAFMRLTGRAMRPLGARRLGIAVLSIACVLVAIVVVSFRSIGGGLATTVGLVVIAITVMTLAVSERERAARIASEAIAVTAVQSEQRLRVTLESIADAVVAVDERGRVTFLNGTAQALTAWTAAEAIGRPLQDVLVIVDEASREPVRNPVQRVLREGVTTTLASHAVLISKDGREIPIDDATAPIRAADGTLTGAVVVFRNVSEHREAERQRTALIAQERRARAEAERVNERLHHVQAVTDSALTSLGLHDFLRQLLTRVRVALGSETATVLLLEPDGTHLRSAASDGHREEIGDESRVRVGTGVAGRIATSADGLIIDDLARVDVESRFLREHVKSLVGAPLRVGNRLIGVIHVGALAPRQFTSDDLQLLRLVADRAAVAVERVRLHDAAETAREKAEAANRMKDDFLAMLSHELRTPLTSILGWARMLRTSSLDEEARQRAFEVIERNARAQVALVEDLLDISRIVRGDVRLDLRPVDIGAIVETAVDAVRASAETKGVALRCARDEAPGPVVGDPGRLQQIVGNLLVNAVKFTPAGGDITVRLERVDTRVRITVTDTGAGISPDLLPHVFDRFRQGPSARQHGGLGLGLAIVQQMVELHGGTVRAESAGEGQGATFTVVLPCASSSSVVA